MTITLVAVMSLNSKITQGLDIAISDWASNEDGDFFKKLLAKHKVFIMGSTTYNSVKPRPSAEKLRIILSRNPSSHQDEQISGKIEFTDASPAIIVADLKKRGHGQALLLGGSEIYSLFLDSGLVSEMYITIEPSIFGTGLNLANNLTRNIDCELISVEVLNKKGSLLLHYKNL